MHLQDQKVSTLLTGKLQVILFKKLNTNDQVIPNRKQA